MRYASILFATLAFAPLSVSLAAGTDTTPKAAETTASPAAPAAAAAVKPERVSGVYKIARIEKKPDDEFVLRFEAQAKDGVHDKLVLNSDGLNVKVSEGQILKISAEVLPSSAKEHEITQVLLFLPSQDYGLTPIWLLSKTHETHEIRGARWLEMHAPQADYQVF